MSSQDKDTLEKRILDLLRESPTPVKDEYISNKLGIDKKTLIKTLNPLSNTQVEFHVGKNGKGISFKLITNFAKEAQTLEGLLKFIYNQIRISESKGVSSKDLKYTTKQNIDTINKYLKILEEKKFIKAVTKGRLKTYYLYGVEPEFKGVGKSGFTLEDIEKNYTDILAEHCFKYLFQKHEDAKKLYNSVCEIKAHSMVALNELDDHLKEMKFASKALKSKDVELLLQTLVFGGRVERTIKASANSKGPQKFYNCCKGKIADIEDFAMPCIKCSYIDQCGEGNSISPATCKYMTAWLTLQDTSS